MTLATTLHRHLAAIAARDLDALGATVAPDDVVVVTAEGEVYRGRDTFIERHRAWFAQTTWRLDADVLHVREAESLATVLLALRYRDVPSDGPAIDQQSVLSLVFRRDGDRWLMVEDQNTPVQATAR